MAEQIIPGLSADQSKTFQQFAAKHEIKIHGFPQAIPEWSQENKEARFGQVKDAWHQVQDAATKNICLLHGLDISLQITDNPNWDQLVILQALPNANAQLQQLTYFAKPKDRTSYQQIQTITPNYDGEIIFGFTVEGFFTGNTVNIVPGFSDVRVIEPLKHILYGLADALVRPQKLRRTR